MAIAYLLLGLSCSALGSLTVFRSPPATVTFVRYLAESGSTVTHSGVTNSPLSDETKRGNDSYCSTAVVFRLAVHRSFGACASLQEQVLD